MCNLYGEDDNFKSNAHVIPALIKTFSNSKDTIITLRGTGRAKRQFLHVDDLAPILINMAIDFNEPKTDHVIIASTLEYSIKQVADILSEYYKKDYIFDNDTQADGQLRKYGIGIYPKEEKNLKNRLIDVCQWYEQNQGRQRNSKTKKQQKTL